MTIARIVPAAFTTTATGTQNDFPFQGARTIYFNNASLITINGFEAGEPGQLLTVISIGAGLVSLAHQNAGSTGSCRLINFATVGLTSLAAGVGAATYVYDGAGSAARWRLIAHQQGAFITPTFAAGDYTANGAMTWTVASGSVSTMAYMLSGRQLAVMFQVEASTTLGGVANTTLIRTLPGGFTVAKVSQQPCIVNDPAIGVLSQGKCFVTAGGTTLNFRTGYGAAVWGLGATAGLFGVLALEVQ